MISWKSGLEYVLSTSVPLAFLKQATKLVLSSEETAKPWPRLTYVWYYEDTYYLKDRFYRAQIFCSPSPQKEVSIWADLTFHRYSVSTWNIVYDIWKLRDYYIQQIQWVQCGIRSIFTQHTFPTFKVQQENKSISSWTWSMQEFE